MAASHKATHVPFYSRSTPCRARLARWWEAERERWRHDVVRPVLRHDPLGLGLIASTRCPARPRFRCAGHPMRSPAGRTRSRSPSSLDEALPFGRATSCRFAALSRSGAGLEIPTGSNLHDRILMHALARHEKDTALTLVWRNVIGAGFALPRDAGLETGGPFPAVLPAQMTFPSGTPTPSQTAPSDSTGNPLSKPPRQSGTSPGPGTPPTSRRRISRRSACRHHVDGRRTARR